MKTKNVWRFMMIIVFALVCCMFYSCSKEESQKPKPDDVPEEVTGEVSFSIDNGSENGSGSGSSSSPAVASQGQPLDMAISQKSSYTDPNGSVYTCEPKATIKLEVKQDTLYVKDLQTLISVSESSEQKTTGSNPVCKATSQKFNVGGQEIAFDLAHEIYTYVNSQSTAIEMPYVKVNSAKYGAAEPKEVTRSVIAPKASVTGIRLKRIGSATRGVVVTTSQAYEVNVSFNLDIESVNTAKANKQNLSFEANYVGVVETSTELPDPVTELKYKLEILGGTGSQASPFEVNKGETLSLQWNEESRYSYFSPIDLQEKVLLYEPKVKVSLKADVDTVWVENKSELENVSSLEPTISTFGDNTILTTGKRTFEIGKQKITVDYSYDAYASMMVDEDEVSMPYLEAQKPEIENVSVRELDVVKVNGKDVRFYEVTVKISQELRSVNLAEPVSERVQYIVKYIGAEEIRLVKVTYRKSYEWEEAHDNIILAVFPIVYRDRTYSTGETFTDTFIDNGRFPSWGTFTHGEYRDEIFITGEEEKGSIGDSIYWSNITIGVPDLSMVQIDFNARYDDELPGIWSKYMLEKSYAEASVDFPLEGVQIVGADSVSTQPSGWYYFPARYQETYGYIYLGEGCRYPYVATMNLDSAKIDQYLVIDGQMINFLNFRGPYTFSYTEEDATMADGSPAKVCTFKGEIIFYGKYFSGTATITFYQYDKH